MSFETDWFCTDTPCPKCNARGVKYREWESSCGGYEDTNYKCDNCQYEWWVDGIDS